MFSRSARHAIYLQCACCPKLAEGPRCVEETKSALAGMEVQPLATEPMDSDALNVHTHTGCRLLASL
eukprot:9133120-Lingulodinium_polyedra.AAC.1